jgi:hypothetical protein
VADTGTGDHRGGRRAGKGDQRHEQQAGLHGILLDES